MKKYLYFYSLILYVTLAACAKAPIQQTAADTDTTSQNEMMHNVHNIFK